MKKLAIVAALLLTLYAIIGFFVVPRVVKSKIVNVIREQTGIEASLGKVSTNPFALSATLRDFALPDKRGERLTSFREFYINFEVSSIFRGGYVFAEIRLKDPYLRLLNRADGTINLDDVRPPRSDSATATADTGRPPATLFIDQLGIEKAVIEYEDRQRPTPFVTRLDSLDLSLQDFATRPDDEGDYHFQATTYKGEGLKWRGQISLFPFRSRGHLELTGLKARTGWEYVQDQFVFEVADGQVEFQADYETDFALLPPLFNVSNGSGQIRSLRILDRRDSTQAMQIPILIVSGIEAQASRFVLRIARISTDSGSVFTARQPDSTMTLNTLFLPKLDSLAPDTASPWTITVDSLLVSEYAMVMEDRTTTPTATLQFNQARLALANYVYGSPGATAQLTAVVHQQAGGLLSAEGTYVPDPFEARLNVKVDSLVLTPYQPYVNRMGELDLVSGTLSLSGAYGLRGGELWTDFDGNIRLNDVRAVDRVLNEDFLRWAGLELLSTRYSDSPAGLSIDGIVVRQPYLRMIIGPDRTTNVQHIMGTLPDSLAASDSAWQESAEAVADTAQVLPTSIGKVTIADGTLNFSDLSLRPNFSVGIQELNGAITGLSSDQIDSAVLELDGKVDQYAPVTIRGMVNPLAESTFSDITMKFQSIELTTFTPYSGKFLGYKIDKGKLHLDLHYVLTGRQLDSENKIVIDQLTLGEKVESPDATSLPLKLAIALLKDSHGVIDLDIPVKGSLDDPQFSVMPIVWKVLLNLLIKAVTSPFKLLGAIFGGGDDLDLEFVNFAPGADALAPAELVKLDTLARALIERPGLKLDIRGAAAPELERGLLATRAVTSQLQQADTAWTVGTLSKLQKERMFAQYQNTFHEDPYLLSPEKDVAGNKVPKEIREAAVQEAAFRRLVDTYTVSDSEFRALAQSRAAAIKDHMVITGGIEEVRIFLQDAEIDAEGVLGEVRMKLSLDAR